MHRDLSARGAAAPVFRAVVTVLALLHLGPGMAFALLAFGCDAGAVHLAPVCGRHEMTTFALLTVGVWLVLGLGLLSHRQLRRAQRAAPPATAARVAALFALLALGLTVAGAGAWLTGSATWALAIPACLAVGWIVLADPMACEAGQRR